MTVQQDQLSPTNTATTFETFNSEFSGTNQDWVDRVLHNGTDILKATLWGKTGQNIIPKFKYYQTNGTEKVSYTPTNSGMLDVCYDRTTDKYFTVRLRTILASGIGPDPDDNFTLPAGPGVDYNKWFSFNEVTQTGVPTKNWNIFAAPSVGAYPNAAEFARNQVSGSLIFNTLSGTPVASNRFLFSRYYFNSDFEATIDYNALQVADNLQTYVGLAVHEDTEFGSMLYQVGISRSGSVNLFEKIAILDRQSFTVSQVGGISVNPSIYKTSGTQDFTLQLVSGSPNNSWQLSNPTLGSASTVQSGTNITRVSLSGVNLQVVFSALTNIGENYTFKVSLEVDTRTPTSGTLFLAKAGNTFSTFNSTNFDETITSTNLRVGLFGTTTGPQSPNQVVLDNFQITTGTQLYDNYPVLTIERVSDQGIVQQSIINSFDIIQTPSTVLSELISGTVAIAVSPSQVMYAKVRDRIYSFSSSGTFVGVVNSGTGGITTSTSGLVPSSGITSFMYNGLAGTSLNYVSYDTNTTEVRYKSLSTAQPPVAQAKEVFLNIPDFNEYLISATNKPYQLYLHATDNNSLFYLRENGSTNVNATKVTGTAGTFSSPTLVDATRNFTTSLVKKGDLVTGTSGAILGITFLVKNVINITTLELMTLNSGAIPSFTPGTYSYIIRSNAELMQFNIDPTISAFSAVNSDDYSLQAGTGDIAAVTVEVINAWGEALSGKTVTFLLVQGDGVINPPSAVTNGAGVATTQYTAGASAGAVQIQVTISD